MKLITVTILLSLANLVRAEPVPTQGADTATSRVIDLGQGSHPPQESAKAPRRVKFTDVATGKERTGIVVDEDAISHLIVVIDDETDDFKAISVHDVTFVGAIIGHN